MSLKFAMHGKQGGTCEKKCHKFITQEWHLPILASASKWGQEYNQGLLLDSILLILFKCSKPKS